MPEVQDMRLALQALPTKREVAGTPLVLGWTETTRTELRNPDPGVIAARAQALAERTALARRVIRRSKRIRLATGDGCTTQATAFIFPTVEEALAFFRADKGDDGLPALRAIWREIWQQRMRNSTLSSAELMDVVVTESRELAVPDQRSAIDITATIGSAATGRSRPFSTCVADIRIGRMVCELLFVDHADHAASRRITERLHRRLRADAEDFTR